MRMPMAVIVVMMMLVVVMTSPGRDRRAFGIGAAFGIEWRHDRLAMATQALDHVGDHMIRSEEHTYELQSLMRISYAVFCLKKKKILKASSSVPIRNLHHHYLNILQNTQLNNISPY